MKLRSRFRKPVTLLTVKKAAELLLIQQQKVNANLLEELLELHYYNTSNVNLPAMLEQIADSENWLEMQLGTFVFGADTQASLEVTLEKAQRQVQLKVQGNFLDIVWNNGEHSSEEMESNRKAMYFARKFIMRKIQEGYYKSNNPKSILKND